MTTTIFRALVLLLLAAIGVIGFYWSGNGRYQRVNDVLLDTRNGTVYEAKVVNGHLRWQLGVDPVE